MWNSTSYHTYLSPKWIGGGMLCGMITLYTSNGAANRTFHTNQRIWTHKLPNSMSSYDPNATTLSPALSPALYPTHAIPVSDCFGGLGWLGSLMGGYIKGMYVHPTQPNLTQPNSTSPNLVHVGLFTWEWARSTLFSISTAEFIVLVSISAGLS